MKRIKALFIFAMTAVMILSASGAMAAPAGETETGTEKTTTSSTSDQPLIRTFTITEKGNGSYRASWNITNVSETVYVRIYAAQSREDFSGTLVESIESGTHGSVDINMPDLDSGYYIFYMSATSLSGVAGYKYSDDYYFFDNTARNEKLSNIRMCREDKTLYVMWDGGQQASVLLFDADTGELISRSDPLSSPAMVSLPSNHKKILAGAADYSGGLLGRFETVDVSTLNTSSAEIILPDKDVTGSSEMEFSVKAEGEYTLKVYKNGTETDYFASGKENQYTIPLDEGENDIRIFLTDSKGGMRAASINMLSDTIAPELVIVDQTNDVKTVDEEITLKGYADDDAVVKYLGEEIDLAGGCFYLRVPLGFGKNQFTLSASDQAGNLTEKTVTVERVFWSQKNIVIILLAISVAAVIIVEAILLFYKSDRKRKPDLKHEKSEKTEEEN